ncbi:MAG: class I adenylate-forming enzyme family protein, partial [Eubacteriales bacterium]|nr:class I adenylate-forming enzyme family protein [Eubacteriales bacterium]
MAQYDILQSAATLRDSMRLETIFELSCAHEDAQAAVWLEDGEEKSWTFAEYRQLTLNYAAFLRAKIGAEKGAYVAICADTCKEWFPMFWGVIQAGYNALLLDASLTDEMAAFLMKQAGAKAIVCAKERKVDGVRLLTRELFAAPAAPEGFAPDYADSVALCTSGTTGTSRVFVYNGAAVAEQVLSSELLYQENRRIIDNENRRSLAFLPYHHVLGFMVNLMWISFLGYANVYLKDRAPQTIVETAQKGHVNLLIAVPLLANNLCSSLQKKVARENRFKRAMFGVLKGISLGVQSVAPSFGLALAEKVLFRGVDAQLLGNDLKLIILGGSHTPSEHLRLLNALGYYTVCGFGMTETAVTSVETSLSLRKRVSGSVGRPLRNVEYRIKPGEKSGRHGEMLIRGRSIHTGRLVDGRLLPPDTLEGSWYPTGDVVRLEKGDRMFVEGRCKDVIINESGENVYPDELEDTFSALVGVEQFTVLGIQKPGKNQKYEDITLVMNVGEAYKDDAFLA